MIDPLEIVAILDVNASVQETEYRHLLAQERREVRRLHLSACGAPAPVSGDGTLRHPDWAVLGRAVETLATHIQEALHGAGDRPVELYLIAKAPLPSCAQLGAALPRLLTTRAHCHVLNPRHGGAWESYSLQAEPSESGIPFFDVIEGLDLPRADPTQGCVAVVVSTVGGPPRVDAITTLLRERGEPLSRIVQIATSAPMDVTPGNAPAIAEKLKRLLPSLQSCYPDASSYGIFIAGPTPLAFMVGQAINRNQFADGKIWFSHFHQGRYAFALSLPFRVLGQVPIPDSADDREARRAVLDQITEGIDELKRSLQADDLPSWEEAPRRQRLLRFLCDLQVAKEPGSDEFGLNVLHRCISLGRGLAQALREETAETQRCFGQLLLLHEIFHDGQDLRTSNYYGVGRAGVVLEQVDFDADTFALTVLIKWLLRRGGADAQERTSAHAARCVDVLLKGIASFDRAEQGARMERLYERRLRRYLVWHLQRARANTLRSPNDVEALFTGRLTVELAPLAGHLDERFDKLVQVPRSDTELFVALNGHLIRQGRSHQISLDDLVSAVREFDLDPKGRIARVMHTLVDAHRHALVPWASEGAI